MSVLIPGILVITSFLVASALMFNAFLTTSASQGDSLKDLAQVSQERLNSAISISGGAAADSGGGTNMSVPIDNSGARSVVTLAEVDVIVDYTDTGDNRVLTYLTYNPDALGDNQWTTSATGITPDTFNPNIWDPDETYNMDLRVVPQVKSGSLAQVVVTIPGGAGDQTTISN